MEFSDKDKMDCAARELRQRLRVYPRLVDAGKMTQSLADRQIALMEAIVRDYEARVKAGMLL